MKKSFLILTMFALVLTSCSKEETSLDNDVTADLSTEVNTKAPGYRVSVTGNQDFLLQARLQSNGTSTGFWRDTQNGMRVDVDCIYVYTDGFGTNAIVTGTAVRGSQAGQQFVVRVVDGQVDGISHRPPSQVACEEVNPMYLFPMPVNTGQVSVNP